MASEVSAVHRRHVSRLERPEVACLVPIVEMAAEALETAHAGQDRFEALDGLECPDPAEIPGGDRREQREADVGRRGAMRHDPFGIFLEIVWGQVVVRRADEYLEETPAAPRGGAQRPGFG